MSEPATIELDADTTAMPHTKPKQDVVTTREQPPVPAGEMTPMLMLDRAVQSGASMETLERLMALQERWERNQARAAFDRAMADAKAEIPVITKNRHVGFESKKAGASNTSYMHEDLGQIARTVDPILANHGLTYRFRTSSPINEPVSVTCIVSHRDGHSEENTLSAGRDDSGNKNSIQSVGSTITYLQRYTLKAALGLAAAADDDGAKAGGSHPTITDEQVSSLQQLIMDADADIPEFLKFFSADTMADIKAKDYERAVVMLEKKKAKAAEASS
ncbi:ERF family protein [Bauldia litoralis]|uniref:ERF family protein n=1 Tax=Bauldia litoralis TaxID=665467 RepID=UPI0032675E49